MPIEMKEITLTYVVLVFGYLDWNTYSIIPFNRKNKKASASLIGKY